MCGAPFDSAPPMPPGWLRLLRPDAVTLEGLMLAARGVKDVQARVDARWLALHPKA